MVDTHVHSTIAPYKNRQEDCVNQALLNIMEEMRAALQQAFGWDMAARGEDDDGPTIVE